MKRVLVLIMLAVAISASAQSPRDQLDQLAAQLRGSPADQALRERIIKLAREIKPGPAVPEGARRPLVQGNSVLEEAKAPEELDRAIAFYRSAADLAPWWADAYAGLARALERRQKHAEAIAALKLYLLAAPDAADARQAQDRIYVLEEKVDRAARAMAESAAAQRAAEALRAQRKQWAASTTQQLNAMFAGKRVRRTFSCTVGKTSLGGGATRDNGCTLQEHAGNNWFRYDVVNPSGVRFELSLDGEKILFHEGFDNRPYAGAGEFPARTGTPTGPGLNDVSWLDSDGKPLQLIFWSNSSGTFFERSNSPVPRNAPGFNASERYYYTQHFAQ